jgi:hypothetical protein
MTAYLGTGTEAKTTRGIMVQFSAPVNENTTRLVSRGGKWCNGRNERPTITEAAMSDVNEYLDKCLAECPEGAEELLLGELAKRVLRKYGPLDRIEVRDRSGLVAYLESAFIDPDDLPPDQEALLNLVDEVNRSNMSDEEFEARLSAETEKVRLRRAQAAAAREGVRS